MLTGAVCWCFLDPAAQDGRASSSAQTGGQHADSPERLSHTAQVNVCTLHNAVKACM